MRPSLQLLPLKASHMTEGGSFMLKTAWAFGWLSAEGE